jgi:L-threonylcarbamoyladenylate synthase
MGGRILNLKEEAAVLRGGGVAMHPTETCYGLAADIFNQEALKKLYKIKKMRADKPVSIMVRSLKEAQKYAWFNRIALKLAKKFWPGPLTLILPRKKALPAYLNPGHKTVGVRCPDSKIAQALIKAAGGPLTTTSANISGKPEVYSVPAFCRQTGKNGLRPDLIIDAGKITKNKPSTIVEASGAGLKILREGALAEDCLL